MSELIFPFGEIIISYHIVEIEKGILFAVSIFITIIISFCYLLYVQKRTCFYVCDLLDRYEMVVNYKKLYI